MKVHNSIYLYMFNITAYFGSRKNIYTFIARFTNHPGCSILYADLTKSHTRKELSE